MRLIVGLAGASGSGKDTAANALIRAYGFRRLAFADALKVEVAHLLRGTLDAYVRERFSRELIDLAGVDELVHRVLYDDRTPVTRRLLQEWGTELRRAEEPSYWVDRWRETVHRLPASARVVCPDVRFHDEVAAILHEGGYVARVERFGVVASGHASETSLDDFHGWHGVLVNDGTISDLEATVLAWTERLLVHVEEVRP